uniref:Uncharacterized protein n=1 Tax=Arundo donax TaxID=35708 RepID=A0A0A9C6L9_ARUDO
MEDGDLSSTDHSSSFDGAIHHRDAIRASTSPVEFVASHGGLARELFSGGAGDDLSLGFDAAEEGFDVGEED